MCDLEGGKSSDQLDVPSNVLYSMESKAILQMIKNGIMPIGMRKGLTYQIHSMMLG